MHSPYASKERFSNEVTSLRFRGVFGVCVSMWVWCVCCGVVCMALTVQEHKRYTPDSSVLLLLVFASRVSALLVGKSSQIKSLEVHVRVCPRALPWVSGRAEWVRIQTRWAQCIVWLAALPRRPLPDPVRSHWRPRSYPLPRRQFQLSQQPQQTPDTAPLSLSACPWPLGHHCPQLFEPDLCYGTCHNQCTGLFADRLLTAVPGH